MNRQINVLTIRSGLMMLLAAVSRSCCLEENDHAGSLQTNAFELEPQLLLEPAASSQNLESQLDSSQKVLTGNYIISI